MDVDPQRLAAVAGPASINSQELDQPFHAALARATAGLSPIGLRLAFADPGISGHHKDIVAFVGRQVLDLFSPTNAPWTNPEVIERTVRDGGFNFLRDALHVIENWQRPAVCKGLAGMEKFQVGQDVAVTQCVCRLKQIDGSDALA